MPFLLIIFLLSQAWCYSTELHSDTVAAEEQDNIIGRTLLQKPNAIEIDGCKYASADKECKNGYVEQLIVGGKKVDSEKYPFFVSLRKQRNDPNNSKNQFIICYEHFCGGSLILDDVVITAAHCIEEFVDTNKTGLQEVTVAILATRESKCRHQNGIEDLLVGWIYIHPYYTSNDDSYNNDIALLFLRGQIQQTDAIINYANAIQYENEAEQVGYNAGIVGFGITTLEPKKESLLDSARLKEASTRLRGYFLCLGLLSDFGPQDFSWANILDNQTMMCAFSQRADACNGDSGGPLFIKTSLSNTITLTSLRFLQKIFKIL